MRMALLGGAALAWPPVVRVRQAARLFTICHSVQNADRPARNLIPFNIHRRTHQIIYREGRKVLMNILDIETPLIAAVNGPARLHSEYILLADIVLATPSTVFQDKPHFEFGIVPGDGVHLLWQEVIGSVRGRYFILTRQELDAERAKEWGAVNEIVPANELLPRAREIAEGLAKLPPLTTKYTRIALTQKLRRLIDEGVTLGLALEGISAADVARTSET
jgi:enoyl-CoA hydratase/carnithine racemase